MSVVDPWQAAAARAAHPSARQIDEGVLAAIARGLAMANVPAAMRADVVERSEQLLATDSYVASLLDLAPGARSAVRRLDSEIAIAVVDGIVELELHLGDTTTVRRIPPGDVATVPAGWRFRLSSPTGPATAVHVSSPPLPDELIGVRSSSRPGVCA